MSTCFTGFSNIVMTDANMQTWQNLLKSKAQVNTLYKDIWGSLLRHFYCPPSGVKLQDKAYSNFLIVNTSHKKANQLMN